jgi:hypothetical protein
MQKQKAHQLYPKLKDCAEQKVRKKTYQLLTKKQACITQNLSSY